MKDHGRLACYGDFCLPVAAAPCNALLGSEDGFDQGEPGCERDDGCEVALRLLAS